MSMCLSLLQLVQEKKYFESSTHRRLIHEDQCVGVGRVIPDTNGAGIPNGGSESQFASTHACALYSIGCGCGWYWH